MDKSIYDLLQLIQPVNKVGCENLLAEIEEKYADAPGSSHNHQAWSGGYLGHIKEVMNLAVHLYKTMNDMRPLPFSLSDALLVLFLHDIEKPWKYSGVSMQSKEEREGFRLQKIKEYGIKLSPEQSNALEFVEGEGKAYSNKRRVMNELAAFCHMCDVASARIWWDYPRL